MSPARSVRLREPWNHVFDRIGHFVFSRATWLAVLVVFVLAAAG